jgi:hypothetical protein
MKSLHGKKVKGWTIVYYPGLQQHTTLICYNMDLDPDLGEYYDEVRQKTNSSSKLINVSALWDTKDAISTYVLSAARSPRSYRTSEYELTDVGSNMYDTGYDSTDIIKYMSENSTFMKDLLLETITRIIDALDSKVTPSKLKRIKDPRPFKFTYDEEAVKRFQRKMQRRRGMRGMFDKNR